LTETTTTTVRARDLRDYLRILSFRKWTALFVFLVVVAGAMYLSYRQEPVYESELRLIVPDVPMAPGVATPPAINLETEANLAASPLVAQRAVALMKAAAFKDARLAWVNGVDPNTLARSVDVVPVDATTILRFRAESNDPERAAELAHYFALGYLDHRMGQVLAPYLAEQQRLTGLIETLETQLAALPATGAGSAPDVGQRRDQMNAERFADERSLAQVTQAIDTIRAANSESAIIQDAEVAVGPARPDHVRDAILAAIAGIVLGLGAAFLRDYVDDTLRGAPDVERQAGTTLIGVIPHVATPTDVARRRGRGAEGGRKYLVAEDDPKAPATEAYRTLRTNLMFMSATSTLRRLLITSPLQGEGKSTTAANLAAVLAQTGQRVLLVGADLRRPSLHRLFAIPDRWGLAGVLAGQVELATAVQDLGIPGLRVLSGGPVPPNPAELLGSPAMFEFLETASEMADWVVLDGPPVFGPAEALVLSSLVDGVLMVVNEASSRRVLAHARDQLAGARARTVGAVLNDFGPAFSYYYSDHYAYPGEYYPGQREPEERSQRAETKLLRKRRRQRESDAGTVDPPGASGNGGPLPEHEPAPGVDSGPGVRADGGPAGRPVREPDAVDEFFRPR
jgi:non-specific protein-tyrosine kinase